MGARRYLAAAGLVAALAGCGFSTNGLVEKGKGGGTSTSTTTTSSGSSGLGGSSTSSTGGGGAGGSGGAATSTSSSGGGAGGKANGKGCAEGAECASGLCVEGVCCNDACTNGCMSCKGDMNGGTAGTCANVVAGKDPKMACDPGKCDGAGACACQNGTKDGNETDIDCGGDCKGCGLTQPCAGDGDCESGHCATEYDGKKLCCATACSGTCNSCDLGPGWSGTCLPRQAGDATPCDPGKACNLSGSCVSGGVNGAQCSGGGNCVSGVCWMSACRPYSNTGGPCMSQWECPGNPGTCNATTHTCQ